VAKKKRPSKTSKRIGGKSRPMLGIRRQRMVLKVEEQGLDEFQIEIEGFLVVDNE
jgi:hypothetical protein